MSNAPAPINIFDKNDYVRLANTANHWVDFSYQKMKKFINDFGDNFNIVIYWQDKECISYYSIPYPFLKIILVKKSLDDRGRWVFSISKGDILHFHKEGKTFIIKSFLKKLTINVNFDPTINPESSEEGFRKLKLHKAIERDKGFIEQIKIDYYISNPEMPCQICGFSFTKRYGELGVGYIEAHHKIPLSDLDEAQKTKKQDIIFVCANCHRMLHRKNPVILECDLKSRLT